MIDFSLTEEQALLQRTARDFAQNEIKPLAREIEKLDYSTARPWEMCKPVFDKAAELGFTLLLIPEKYGGLGRGCIDNVIIQEEFAAADIGIASYLGSAKTYPRILLEGGNEEQRERWLGEIVASGGFLIAGAQSEPDVAGSEAFCPFPNPKLGIKTFARREGDEYVINGSKSAFITNAGVARYYLLYCRTDLSKPAYESTSAFYVPADTPGLTVGKRTEMLGMKAVQHAEVFLDNVRVHKRDMLGEEGEATAIMMRVSPYMATGLGASYVGLARAAYEYALDYARQRQSWGQPIIRHQAIGLMLAEMYVMVQSARMMVWDAAYAVDTGSPLAGPLKAPAAKTYAVEIAIKTAQNAVKILGGYGLTKEYQAEKFLRDAWMGYSCDFTGDMLRLGMAHAL